MIILKSRREIERMRAACRLVAEAHRLVKQTIVPGITTKSIDEVVERLFAEAGATPLFKGVPGKVPFPAVTCISVNEEVVHGIPGTRVLQPGDVVSVDTGCRLEGWCGDAAWTYAVEPIDDLKQRLMAAGQAALEVAIEGLGECRVWSEVARRIEDTVKQAGFSVVDGFTGHGIGQEMHEDPQVPNFVSPKLRDRDFDIEPGLVLAIEPMVNAGKKQVKVTRDHWTVVTCDRKPSVHFEHTVAVTEEGPRVLTEGVGQ